MTGERIDAEEAVRIGLVQELAPDPDTAMDRARQLCSLVTRRSPTAVAAFKRAVLAAVGSPPARRAQLEAVAYEHCVDTGEAARGRAGFARIRRGEAVDWAPLRSWAPEER